MTTEELIQILNDEFHLHFFARIEESGTIMVQVNNSIIWIEDGEITGRANCGPIMME